MKKILSFLAAAALVVSCSKTDEAPIASTYTLTGHTATTTRVEFDSYVDFGIMRAMTIRWSAGDQIWVGSQQSYQQSDHLTAGDTSQATFTLPSAPQSGDQVIYNMMANSSAEASIAVVPAEQNASQSLGENGAFARADLSDDDSFILEYQTNTLWFNVTALPPKATLKSIRLDAGDAIVAGSAAWEAYDEWGDVSNGSSIINLKVDKSSVSANEYIAMVILPPADMTIPSATIFYDLEIEGVKKYYEQTLGEKEFTTGELARVSVDLSAVELRDFRTLTFEGDYWTAKISNTAYGMGNGTYPWSDEDNTELSFTPNSQSMFTGMGGHAISNYTGDDLTTLAPNAYSNIDLQAYDVDGGANGSANFCVHFGWVDDSGYGMMDRLVGFEFDDNVARTIESMYVTNTTYCYHSLAVGDEFMVPDGGVPNDCWVKIIAYGYDDINDPDESPDSQTEFYLLKEGRNFVTDWTKWDLSGLGKVKKVRFNMVGSQYCYEDHLGNNSALGFIVPAYFAYDDVVVRF